MVDAGASRELPEFFVEWRAGWGPVAADWTPLDYLNQQAALPATIAAGWLFNPQTVEYRGAVFLASRFDPAGVDEWFTKYPDEPARIETVVNRTAFYDFFVNCDTDAFAGALAGLAADVAACWRAVLTLRYPDRRVEVVADAGDEPDAYGPAVTFWTGPRA